MAFTSVSLTGTVKLSNSTPAAGASVNLTLSTPITDGTVFVAPETISTRCAADGTFTIAVNANDDSTTQPTGTYYSVVIGYGSQTLDIFDVVVLHADSPTVNLFTLATLPNPNVVSPYVSQLTAGTGITLSPTGGTGAVQITSTGGSGVSVGNPVSGGAASSVLVTDASGNIQSQATPTSAYRRAVWNGTAWKAELAGAVDICAEFGVGTGVTDNSTAINTALATLGALGIEAYLPFPGVGHFYAIQNPVIIGNGSSSAFSTWSAFLRGGGWPGGASTTNEAAPIETKLKWTGSSGYSDAMVQIVGPLTGWGLKNLRIDGGAVPGTPGNAPAFALHTTSSVHGRVDNIGFSGCISGIHHDAYSSVSGALTGVVVDDLMNMVNNVSIQWIGKTAVHSYGLLFDGGANGVSNACYTEYKGVIMTPPNSSYGGGTINDGVYFKKCDSILIHNITCTGPSGTDTNRLVFYDWTGVSKWPKSCFIDVIDFDTGLSTCVSSTGTPTNFAGGMAHNKISNIHGANNQPGNPNVPWLMWGDNAYSGAIQLVSGAATIANVATQAGSYILVSVVTPATVAANQGIPFVNTKTAGTGFTLASTNASDNSWLMYRMFSDSYY